MGFLGRKPSGVDGVGGIRVELPWSWPLTNPTTLSQLLLVLVAIPNPQGSLAAADGDC